MSTFPSERARRRLMEHRFMSASTFLMHLVLSPDLLPVSLISFSFLFSFSLFIFHLYPLQQGYWWNTALCQSQYWECIGLFLCLSIFVFPPSASSVSSSSQDKGKPLTGQSHRGDLEALGHMLIELVLGKLPWINIEAVDEKNLHCLSSVSHFLLLFPLFLSPFCFCILVCHSFCQSKVVVMTWRHLVTCSSSWCWESCPGFIEALDENEFALKIGRFKNEMKIDEVFKEALGR